ncbi:MAG: thioredoxin domain-containing protein, partial [Patescibacteria group bacterium]|nr:thioredoxin domain-containing protein [Patescibacteria group bacterium]
MDTNDMGINKYLIPISILLGAVIIGGALYFGSGKAPAAPTGGTGTQPAAAVDIKNVDTSGSPFIGNANAPVTIAYWSDYQCPFCKQFDETTMQQLVTDYVNTGKAKIVFMDFQFLGPDSDQDAVFARAIWNLYPDKYQAWRTAWYADQQQENTLSASANEKQLEKVTAT